MPNCCRSTVRAGRWIVPGVLIVLMPKCPACLIGYAALAGLTLSMSTAYWVRLSLLVVSIATLSYLVVRVGVHKIGLLRGMAFSGTGDDRQVGRLQET